MKVSLKNFQVEQLDAFDDHQLIYYVNNSQANLTGYVVLHRMYPGKVSFGGTRLVEYKSEIDALLDALKLSKQMTEKLAATGSGYGGAKAVFLSNNITPENRQRWLDAYADYLNLINGSFLTGIDAGLTNEDVLYMSKKTKSLVGLRYDLAAITALGILQGIKVCLQHVFGDDALAKRTIAIKGIGKVGNSVLNLVYDQMESIYVADINPKVIENVQRLYPKVKVVDHEEIHLQAVDVFSPCALGESINKKVVNHLACKIIAGSANNQLSDAELAKTLFKKSILYAPDYILNSGGLISVIDEHENRDADEARLMLKVDKIAEKLEQVFALSEQEKIDTLTAAKKILQTKV